MSIDKASRGSLDERILDLLKSDIKVLEFTLMY